MAAYALPGIFVMGCLVCLMESYVIRCPEQSEWNITAEIQCQNITQYFCLYNSVNYTYEEGCTGPEWDIPGRKRVYSLNFDTAPCRDTRYQPIRFVTNGNSDCIFRKSLCTEEGQTLVSNGTTKTDSTCRCDYTQGYAFVTVPRSKCYCRPSEEDCSCYLKKCQGISYNLSADYECTKDITNNTDCPSISANPYEDPHIDMVPRKDDLYVIKRTCGVAILVSICFFVMIVITICALFHQRLPRCPCLFTNQSGNAESKRMDTGPSFDTIEQNGSKHESAGNAESKRRDTGWSLNTIDQNVTNNQSAVEVHTESENMYTCPSLNTTEQNASNDESAVEVHTESESMDTGLGQSLNTTEQNATSNQPDGNRLEEIVSGNNKDNQVALRESDELKNNIGKERLATAFKFALAVLDNSQNGPVQLAVTGKYGIELRELDGNRKSATEELKKINIKDIKKDLENWRNEPVKLAVTGKSGVGKSSFINAIRNLKSGDPDFATASCSGYTTTHATGYKYPGNPKITLHDLPGFGTTKCPKNEYEKTMELYRYDYFLIFVGNIEENDIEIAKKLKEMKTPFCFVRSKLDVDVENSKNDGEPEANAIEKIMSKSLEILKSTGFKEVKFFVISNRSRRIGDFNELVLYIQSNLPQLKCDAVMFSLLGELSDGIIDSKYKHLKKRILKISEASVGLARDPVSKMDLVFNITLICQELLLYHNTFGFEQQNVKNILKDKYIRQKLNANSIIEIQVADEAMLNFVFTELKKLRTSGARESQCSLMVPFIESDVSEWLSGEGTSTLLTQILDGCRDDAKLVYSHMINVDV